MKMHRRKKHLKITTVKTVVKRSEEHTSELQSQSNLVCRLLLEKKKENNAIAARLGSTPGHRTPVRHTRLVNCDESRHTAFAAFGVADVRPRQSASCRSRILPRQ